MNSKKSEITKPDSEMQVSATDSQMDSVGWRSLPEILESSDKGDPNNSDDTE